jgi:predicted acetyltransferase
VRIRSGRHVELDSLRAVYAAASNRYWGTLVRKEPYWQWLVGRKAHTDLMVAVEGENDWHQTARAPHIVGYAVLYRAQILEQCRLPGYSRAATRLLIRACQDAIERDVHTLTLHTPAADPLHELLVTAGGRWHALESGSPASLLVKLLDPAGWIESVDQELRRRARAARLSLPIQIRIDASESKYCLKITPRECRLIADEQPRCDVRCDKLTFGALLMGNLNLTKALQLGHLVIADAEILSQLTALFPPLLYWQSPFDTLRSS